MNKEAVVTPINRGHLAFCGLACAHVLLCGEVSMEWSSFCLDPRDPRVALSEVGVL